MSLPGTLITQRDAVTPRTAVTDTGTLFAVGLTEKGPTTPTLVESPRAYTATFGGDVPYSAFASDIAAYFRQGGRRVYVGRRVGAGARAASVVLKDASDADSLILSAASVGEYANGFTVTVEQDGANFIISAFDGAGARLFRSRPLTSTADAVSYLELTGTLVAERGAGGAPAATASRVALTGGTDARDEVNDATLAADLAAFDRELGYCGQVAAPGLTTPAAHAALLQHAERFNRFALLDIVDSAERADILDALAQIRSLGEVARNGLPLIGRHIVPGTIPGTTRTVAYSVVQAALIARSDAATGNPNLPAAGENGIADKSLGLTHEWKSDEDREAINDAGGVIARVKQGQVRTYGYRTAVDPVAFPLHWMANNVRLDMAIAAEADAIAERHVFRMIDGEGWEASVFNGELASMLSRYYRRRALYGATPDEAYRVDTGDTVNTPESIAEGRLRAVISIRRSPFAERVEVDIVKSAVTSSI